MEDLVPLLSGKSSLGVTLVSLWAGEQVAEVVQQVWAASHGTTCSQQPQSTLANYYLSSLLQLNTIHIRVSLGASQRPVCCSALDSSALDSTSVNI